MPSSILEELTREEARLKQLDDEQDAILKHISKLKSQLAAASKHHVNQPSVELSPEAKISLFRSLFKGREDVYPKRWGSKTGDFMVSFFMNSHNICTEETLTRHLAFN